MVLSVIFDLLSILYQFIYIVQGMDYFAYGYIIVSAPSIKKVIIFNWIILVLSSRINTNLILFLAPLFHSISLYAYLYTTPNCLNFGSFTSWKYILLSSIIVLIFQSCFGYLALSRPLPISRTRSEFWGNKGIFSPYTSCLDEKDCL